MRCDDVPVRTTKSDQRSYYFDEHVDLVLVNSTTQHKEPPHLHSDNYESYILISGRMIINIEGEEILLQEGDLVTINPGACHHFETMDEEVVFMAIKKEPGLDDKEMC